MVNFKHPSGLRFLQNKKTPFINLKKIIKLAKSLKLVSEDRIIIDELITSFGDYGVHSKIGQISIEDWTESSHTNSLILSDSYARTNIRN